MLLRREAMSPVCAPALLRGPVPLAEPADLARHVLLHPSADRRDWRLWLRAARPASRTGARTGRSYAPEGRTPAVARTAKRIARRMIAAVSDRGLMRFTPCEGALSADRSIAFLRQSAKDAGRKLVPIVDKPEVRKAGEVTAWIESHAHGIEPCHLPSYAPDHNPSECVNNGLKRQQPQAGSERELVKRTRSVPRVIQRSPARVRAYFGPGPVRYAA